MKHSRKQFFKGLADRHNNLFFRHLSEFQLHDLYLLALQIYRLEDDIQFHRWPGS